MKNTNLEKALEIKEQRTEIIETVYAYLCYECRKNCELREDRDAIDYKCYLLHCIAENSFMALRFASKGTKVVCVKEWTPLDSIFSNSDEMQRPVVGSTYTLTDAGIHIYGDTIRVKELDGIYDVDCFQFANGEMLSSDKALALYGDEFESDCIHAFRWEYQKYEASFQKWENFHLDDLQTGDIIVNRNGDKGVCIVEKETIMFQNGSWDHFENYDTQMKNAEDDNTKWDIMLVFRGLEGFGDDDDALAVVYDREEMEDLTSKMEQIRSKLH